MIPILLLALAQAPSDTVPLTRGMVITRSVVIRPGTYRVPGGDSLDTPVVTIRGTGITVDFAGAVLEGLDPAADPDQAAGLGVLVDGGRDVTVRHLVARGYKVGLLARGTRNLHVLDSDVSHNWKPRLFSGITHESLMDWLSHHHNEQGEWLRFGAGIYLDGVRGGVIARNRIEQGMEGLMLTRSDSVEISRNVIEHNSGIGIGLYRSSWNRIVHNRASFNVRGYSHGYFRRGQDSANLLLYEQSSHNFVAWNTMTHGGDGLFLWAGQHTMDTGKGGSNDNLFVGNDFSFAPTNAMEATFSRNRFVGNRAWGSDHGLWGGYSFESQVVGNDFRGNRRAIALEHGQDNLIARNRFSGDSVGIHLWANPIEPSDWGYPKHRDTRSRDIRIVDNTFTRHRVAMRIAGSTNVTIAGNTVRQVDTTLVLGDSVVPGDGQAAATQLSVVHPRGGREAIIVDEWGPYDWQSPRLWPVGSGDSVPVRLRVLGPAGRWQLRDTTHVATLSATSGRVGDTLVVTPARGHENDWRVGLVYEGEAVVLPNGIRQAAGAAVAFGWRRFRPIGTWALSLHTWAEGRDPLSSEAAWNGVVRGEPAARCTRTHLDVVGYRPMLCDVRAERLAVTGRAEVNLAPGRYTLRTISDDAIRVWVDDELVIDAWAPHGSEVHTAPIAPGRHEIRIAYAQREGWMELRVEIVEGDQRSTGSPGPH